MADPMHECFNFEKKWEKSESKDAPPSIRENHNVHSPPHTISLNNTPETHSAKGRRGKSQFRSPHQKTQTFQGGRNGELGTVGAVA